MQSKVFYLFLINILCKKTFLEKYIHIFHKFTFSGKINKYPQNYFNIIIKKAENTF